MLGRHLNTCGKYQIGYYSDLWCNLIRLNCTTQLGVVGFLRVTYG